MTNWNIEEIPKKPGVYLYKDKLDKVIYVGKAKNLRVRINQYKKGSINSFKTHKMIQEAESFDLIITENEKEALILERNLIKEHAPYFNIQFIDDKRYPYIKVKLGKNLKITMVRRILKDNAFYFGPLPVGSKSRQLLKTLQREALYESGLPITDTSKEFWEEKYKKVRKILSADNNFYKRELEGKMFSAADKEMFEIAQEYKESLEALNIFDQRQVVQLDNDKDIDVVGVSQQDDYLFISIMFYRNGSLLSMTNEVLEIINDSNETIRQFVNSYYNNNLVPKELILDEKYSNDFYHSFKPIYPEKGKYKEMLKIAVMNAENNKDEKLRKHKRQVELTSGAIEKLGYLLNIDKPWHILMIDNSNTANQNPVSAIVSYKNGVKQKSEYKKYNLETLSRKADVEYMRQTTTRYFSKKENPIPNLFIVDGGKAQVNEVKEVTERLGVDLRIIGLVKNDKHITRSLINLEGEEVEIKDSTLLNFLRSMQAEVDRFAKVQHRSRGLKGTLEGSLETIPGVGPKTLARLLKVFETYANIYNASQSELEKVVSPTIATNIKKKMK
ncbi:GIY-YIG nuclease family protein [Mycoplasma todarodis]|uniref:Excinuclease ABC subunit C n=1 Tax=Mycoplasma todarodis TaxID=1937191 RepID=A0A4R0XLH7_9MOLU|nr:excinuclease ABC subunit UvrC [Mycoplasma todarodis]TCG11513.1 excinuclease ABC subunit C [Mycoplasma todarodis]